MSVKITGLTRLNVRALQEVFPEAVEEDLLTLTATTATFKDLSAWQAAGEVDRAMKRLPMRGHPRASLHAVFRKLVKEVEK